MNLTAIVNQLLESPIQEADDMFLSEIKANRIDVVGTGGASDASMLVKWRADTDYRSWGIKAIEPVIEAVSGWIEASDGAGGTSTIKLEGFVADGKVESATRSTITLYPQEAEINLRTRSVLVRF
jgi:hypothetical protein